MPSRHILMYTYIHTYMHACIHTYILVVHHDVSEIWGELICGEEQLGHQVPTAARSRRRQMVSLFGCFVFKEPHTLVLDMLDGD